MYSIWYGTVIGNYDGMYAPSRRRQTDMTSYMIITNKNNNMIAVHRKVDEIS